MTKAELLTEINKYKVGFRSGTEMEAAVDAYTEALLQQTHVSRCAYRTWLLKVRKEQQFYPLLKGRELDEAQLLNLWRDGKSPIDALNDLSTAC